MSTLITGKNTVTEAIKAKRKVHELYVQHGTNTELYALFNSHGLKPIEKTKQEMNQLLPKGHQGIAAKVADYTYKTLEEVIEKPNDPKVFLMLDGIEDPHNLGAILRSSDAFKVDAIIIPKNRSAQLNQTVAKVSTGAIEYVDVVQVTNLNQTIKKLIENGFWIVGTDMDTPQTIHDIDVSSNICIVIGSEGFGMSRLVRQNCDYIVKIPMDGHVNSLNASVSTAIVLYEVFKRKGE